MKNLLLLLSCLVMVFAAQAQQPSQENTSYPLDLQATAAASWKLGETIGEEPCLVNEKTSCYIKFLGITAENKALFQEFYASGQKATEPYTATVLPETGELRIDGLYIALHENGQKAGEAHYQNGKIQGLFNLWHANGQKKYEGHYQNGIKQGLFSLWYKNGQKEIEGFYQNDQKQGLWTLWYENGQKKREGHFQDGKPQGHWIYWDENGKVTEEKNFD